MPQVLPLILALVTMVSPVFAEDCPNLGPEGPWPEQVGNIPPSKWPLSAEPTLGLVIGMTPVETCQLLTGTFGFKAFWLSSFANLEPLYDGMTAPFALRFTGRAALFGSGEVVETVVTTYYSAPTSGQQMTSFKVRQSFDAETGPPRQDVVDEAERQLGTATGVAETVLGIPFLAWIVDAGELQDGSPDENLCSIAPLGDTDLMTVPFVENSCQGLMELFIYSELQRVQRITLVVEDRALLVKTRQADIHAITGQ